MAQLLAGIVVMIATVVALLAMLPRGGRTHRLVGSEWEPYVGVAFTSAVALAFTMMLSGALSLAAAQ